MTKKGFLVLITNGSKIKFVLTAWFREAGRGQSWGRAEPVPG